MPCLKSNVVGGEVPVAEIDGEVELPQERKRGKRLIVVRGSDGREVEHVIPPGKPLPPHVANLKLHPDLLKLHMIKAEDYRTLQ